MPVEVPVDPLAPPYEKVDCKVYREQRGKATKRAYNKKRSQNNFSIKQRKEAPQNKAKKKKAALSKSTKTNKSSDKSTIQSAASSSKSSSVPVPKKKKRRTKLNSVSIDEETAGPAMLVTVKRKKRHHKKASKQSKMSGSSTKTRKPKRQKPIGRPSTSSLQVDIEDPRVPGNHIRRESTQEALRLLEAHTREHPDLPLLPENWKEHVLERYDLYNVGMDGHCAFYTLQIFLIPTRRIEGVFPMGDFRRQVFEVMRSMGEPRNYRYLDRLQQARSEMVWSGPTPDLQRIYSEGIDFSLGASSEFYVNIIEYSALLHAMYDGMHVASLDANGFNYTRNFSTLEFDGSPLPPTTCIKRECVKGETFDAFLQHTDNHRNDMLFCFLNGRHYWIFLPVEWRDYIAAPMPMTLPPTIYVPPPAPMAPKARRPPRRSRQQPIPYKTESDRCAKNLLKELARKLNTVVYDLIDPEMLLDNRISSRDPKGTWIDEIRDRFTLVNMGPNGNCAIYALQLFMLLTGKIDNTSVRRPTDRRSTLMNMILDSPSLRNQDLRTVDYQQADGTWVSYHDIAPVELGSIYTHGEDYDKGTTRKGYFNLMDFAAYANKCLGIDYLAQLDAYGLSITTGIVRETMLAQRAKVVRNKEDIANPTNSQLWDFDEFYQHMREKSRHTMFVILHNDHYHLAVPKEWNVQ